MNSPAKAEVTMYLQQIEAGHESAFEKLLPHVYGDLRGLADVMFREQRRNHTLQPTALVHEAYMRLVGPSAGGWENKRHFLRVAAIAMRQILTDYARRRSAEKREGDRSRVELKESLAGENEDQSPVDLISLEEALVHLEKLDERQARIVELRFFAGLTVAETADVLGVSERTVFLDWNMARAWLEQKLS